jgi:serine/threonine protein kinase
LGNPTVDGNAFGRYRLLDLLGRGGMGEVWKAYDTETDRVVAVKVLRADFADDDAYKQRFRREARAAAGLSEPHVVPIHNYGDINGRLYVDMRLIQGRDLQTMLDAGPLEPARAVDIVGQIASALDGAHRIGLVHRDVKPSNILVTERDFAYLIDFGIARTAEDVGLTSTGMTVGTWAYMAPERFKSGAVDARADVYALACVLHEALTGSKPYPGDSIERQIAGHLMQPPPRPSELRSGMPAALDSVIAAGMAKEPRDRYPSTVELARAAKDAVTVPIRHSWPAPNPAPAPRTLPVRGFGHTQQAPWTQAGQPHHLPQSPWHPPGPPHPGASAPARPWWRHPAVLLSALAAVVVAALVIVLAATGSGTDTPRASRTSTSQAATTTTTPPPPPPDIDTLLLSVHDVNTIMGATGMTVNKGGTGLLEDEETISPPECRGIALIISKVEFASTSVLDTRWQNLSEPGPAATHSLIQNIVRGETSSAATSYFNNEVRAWQACDGKQITDTNKQSGQQFTFTYTNFVQRPDFVTMTSKVGALVCQRALGVRGNYLADVSACGQALVNQGELAVTGILARTTA